ARAAARQARRRLAAAAHEARRARSAGRRAGARGRSRAAQTGLETLAVVGRARRGGGGGRRIGAEFAATAKPLETSQAARSTDARECQFPSADNPTQPVKFLAALFIASCARTREAHAAK